MKKILSTLSAIMLITTLSYGQRQSVVGYFPYYANNVNSISWNKMTDVIYAFATLNNDGSMYINGNLLPTVVQKAKSNGANIYLAVGGANNSYNFSAVASNPSARAQFANSAKALVNQYGLDGFDVDWEFPGNQEGDNVLALMIQLRNTLGNNTLISMAVPPISFNSDGYKPELKDYVDFFHLMAYDDSDNPNNHSSFSFTEEAAIFWSSSSGKDIPRSQLRLGVPFYGKTPGGFAASYRDIIAGNQAAGSQTDNYAGYGYNGIPTMKQKAELTLDMGFDGIMIWEVSQDVTGTYSLLNAVDNALSGKSRCQVPDLGDDISSCDLAGLQLNSGVSGGSYSFSWSKDGSPVGSSGSSLSIDSKGDYCVTVSSSLGHCSTKESCMEVRSGSDIVTEGETVCESGDVTFSILTGGVYDWFVNETGGSPIATEVSEYSQNISSTTTLWVEKKLIEGNVGVKTYTATNNPIGITSNYYNFTDKPYPHQMKVTVLQDLLIKSFKMYVGQVGGTVKLKFIPDGSGEELLIEYPVQNIDETRNGEIIIQPNKVLKEGSYIVDLSESTHASSNSGFWIDQYDGNWQGDLNWGYPFVFDNFLRIESALVNWSGTANGYVEDQTIYVGIYDIEASSIPGCGRVPVTSTTESDCTPPVIDMLSPNNEDIIVGEMDVQASVTDVDGSVSTVTMTIFDQTDNSVVEVLTVQNSGSTYSASWSPEEDGNYTVSVIAVDDDGNEDRAQVSVVVDLPLNTVDVLTKYGINIYPNPFSNVLTVKSNKSDLMNISLSDVNGKIVLHSDSFEGINTKKLAPGVYALTIKTSRETITTTVVK